ncbi:hypothetical protein TNCV_318721 [Trichonephila clavipes]|nr:hypothetical protein TNCV_318721 [Trichonephila clavipes]
MTSAHGSPVVKVSDHGLPCHKFEPSKDPPCRAAMHVKSVELKRPPVVPCTRDLAHKTFGPIDLTSTYSLCTRRVFGGTGIKPRPSGLESDALTTRLTHGL